MEETKALLAGMTESVNRQLDGPFDLSNEDFDVSDLVEAAINQAVQGTGQNGPQSQGLSAKRGGTLHACHPLTNQSFTIQRLATQHKIKGPAAQAKALQAYHVLTNQAQVHGQGSDGLTPAEMKDALQAMVEITAREIGFDLNQSPNSLLKPLERVILAANAYAMGQRQARETRVASRC